MIISVFDSVQNIEGKGENAGNQHFLLFPQCFQKASFSDTSKGVIVWEWVKSRDLGSNGGVFKCSRKKFELLVILVIFSGCYSKEA